MAEEEEIVNLLINLDSSGISKGWKEARKTLEGIAPDVQKLSQQLKKSMVLEGFAFSEKARKETEAQIASALKDIFKNVLHAPELKAIDERIAAIGKAKGKQAKAKLEDLRQEKERLESQINKESLKYAAEGARRFIAQQKSELDATKRFTQQYLFHLNRRSYAHKEMLQSLKGDDKELLKSAQALHSAHESLGRLVLKAAENPHLVSINELRQAQAKYNDEVTKTKNLQKPKEELLKSVNTQVQLSKHLTAEEEKQAAIEARRLEIEKEHVELLERRKRTLSSPKTSAEKFSHLDAEKIKETIQKGREKTVSAEIGKSVRKDFINEINKPELQKQISRSTQYIRDLFSQGLIDKSIISPALAQLSLLDQELNRSGAATDQVAKKFGQVLDLINSSVRQTEELNKAIKESADRESILVEWQKQYNQIKSRYQTQGLKPIQQLDRSTAEMMADVQLAGMKATGGLRPKTLEEQIQDAAKASEEAKKRTAKFTQRQELNAPALAAMKKRMNEMRETIGGSEEFAEFEKHMHGLDAILGKTGASEHELNVQTKWLQAAFSVATQAEKQFVAEQKAIETGTAGLLNTFKTLRLDIHRLGDPTLIQRLEGFEAIFADIESGTHRDIATINTLRSAVKNLSKDFQALKKEAGFQAADTKSADKMAKDLAGIQHGAGVLSARALRTGVEYQETAKFSDIYKRAQDLQNRSMGGGPGGGPGGSPGGGPPKDPEEIKRLAAEYRNLTAEYKILAEQVKQTSARESQHQEIMSKQRQLLSDVNSVAQNLAFTFGAIGAAAGAALKIPLDAFAKLEAIVNRFSGVTYEMGESMQKIAMDAEALKAEVLDIATSSSKSADQIANTAVIIGKLGFSAKETTEMLRAITLASEASGESTEIVGETIAGTIRTFGLSAKDAGMVADMLSAAAVRSATDFAGLNETIKYMGPIAHASGQQLKDVLPIVEILANNMIKNSQAGTAMKQMYLKLTKPTKEATELLKALGVQAIDPVTKKFRVGADIFHDLANSLTNVSEKSRLAAVKGIFDDRAAVAVSALTNTMRNNEAAVRKTVASYEDVNGMTQRMKDVSFRGLQAELQKLSATWNAFLVDFGAAAAPVFLPMIKTLADLIKSFAGLSDAAKGVLVQIGLWTTVGAVFSAATMSIVSFGTGVVKAFHSISDFIGLTKAYKTAMDELTAATATATLAQDAVGASAIASGGAASKAAWNWRAFWLAVAGPAAYAALAIAVITAGISAFQKWNEEQKDAEDVKKRDQVITAIQTSTQQEYLNTLNATTKAIDENSAALSRRAHAISQIKNRTEAQLNVMKALNEMLVATGNQASLEDIGKAVGGEYVGGAALSSATKIREIAQKHNISPDQFNKHTEQFVGMSADDISSILIPKIKAASKEVGLLGDKWEEANNKQKTTKTKEDLFAKEKQLRQEIIDLDREYSNTYYAQDKAEVQKKLNEKLKEYKDVNKQVINLLGEQEGKQTDINNLRKDAKLAEEKIMHALGTQLYTEQELLEIMERRNKELDDELNKRQMIQDIALQEARIKAYGGTPTPGYGRRDLVSSKEIEEIQKREKQKTQQRTYSTADTSQTLKADQSEEELNDKIEYFVDKKVGGGGKSLSQITKNFAEKDARIQLLMVNRRLWTQKEKEKAQELYASEMNKRLRKRGESGPTSQKTFAQAGGARALAEHFKQQFMAAGQDSETAKVMGYQKASRIMQGKDHPTPPPKPQVPSTGFIKTTKQGGMVILTKTGAAKTSAERTADMWSQVLGSAVQDGDFDLVNYLAEKDKDAVDMFFYKHQDLAELYNKKREESEKQQKNDVKKAQEAEKKAEQNKKESSEQLIDLSSAPTSSAPPGFKVSAPSIFGAPMSQVPTKKAPSGYVAPTSSAGIEALFTLNKQALSGKFLQQVYETRHQQTELALKKKLDLDKKLKEGSATYEEWVKAVDKYNTLAEEENKSFLQMRESEADLLMESTKRFEQQTEYRKESLKELHDAQAELMAFRMPQEIESVEKARREAALLSLEKEREAKQKEIEALFPGAAFDSAKKEELNKLGSIYDAKKKLITEKSKELISVETKQRRLALDQMIQDNISAFAAIEQMVSPNEQRAKEFELKNASKKRQLQLQFEIDTEKDPEKKRLKIYERQYEQLKLNLDIRELSDQQTYEAIQAENELFLAINQNKLAYKDIYDLVESINDESEKLSGPSIAEFQKRLYDLKGTQPKKSRLLAAFGQQDALLQEQDLLNLDIREIEQKQKEITTKDSAEWLKLESQKTEKVKRRKEIQEAIAFVLKTENLEAAKTLDIFRQISEAANTVAEYSSEIGDIFEKLGAKGASSLGSGLSGFIKDLTQAGQGVAELIATGGSSPQGWANTIMGGLKSAGDISSFLFPDQTELKNQADMFEKDLRVQDAQLMERRAQFLYEKGDISASLYNTAKLHTASQEYQKQLLENQQAMDKELSDAFGSDTTGVKDFGKWITESFRRGFNPSYAETQASLAKDIEAAKAKKDAAAFEELQQKQRDITSEAAKQEIDKTHELVQLRLDTRKLQAQLSKDRRAEMKFDLEAQNDAFNKEEELAMVELQRLDYSAKAMEKYMLTMSGIESKRLANKQKYVEDLLAISMDEANTVLDNYELENQLATDQDSFDKQLVSNKVKLAKEVAELQTKIMLGYDTTGELANKLRLRQKEIEQANQEIERERERFYKGLNLSLDTIKAQLTSDEFDDIQAELNSKMFDIQTKYEDMMRKNPGARNTLIQQQVAEEQAARKAAYQQTIEATFNFNRSMRDLLSARAANTSDTTDDIVQSYKNEVADINEQYAVDLLNFSDREDKKAAAHEKAVERMKAADIRLFKESSDLYKQDLNDYYELQKLKAENAHDYLGVIISDINQTMADLYAQRNELEQLGGDPRSQTKLNIVNERIKQLSKTARQKAGEDIISQLQEIQDLREAIYKDEIKVYEQDIKKNQREVDKLQRQIDKLESQRKAIENEIRNQQKAFNIEDKTKFRDLIKTIDLASNLRDALEYISNPTANKPFDYAITTAMDAIKTRYEFQKGTLEYQFGVEDIDATKYYTDLSDLEAQRAKVAAMAVAEIDKKHQEEIATLKEQGKTADELRVIEKRQLQEKLDAQNIFKDAYNSWQEDQLKLIELGKQADLDALNSQIESNQARVDSLNDLNKGYEMQIGEIRDTFDNGTDVINTKLDEVKLNTQNWRFSIDEVKASWEKLVESIGNSYKTVQYAFSSPPGISRPTLGSTSVSAAALPTAPSANGLSSIPYRDQHVAYGDPAGVFDVKSTKLNKWFRSTEERDAYERMVGVYSSPSNSSAPIMASALTSMIGSQSTQYVGSSSMSGILSSVANITPNVTNSGNVTVNIDSVSGVERSTVEAVANSVAAQIQAVMSEYGKSNQSTSYWG